MDKEDILLEIFSWLPKISLLRSEAVCKRWQRLIRESASSFAASARSIDQYGSIVLRDELERRRPTFSRFDKKGCLVRQDEINLESIVGPLCRNASSRNPVVCYCTEEKKPNINPQRSYHVYNPLTLHHTLIPPMTSSSKSDDINPFLQLYKDRNSYLSDLTPIPICMGYAPSSEEDGSPHFKFVVATYVSFSPHKIEFSIFDSEIGVWETEPPQKCSCPRQADHRYMSGCVDIMDACPSCLRRQTDKRYVPGWFNITDVCVPCLSLHGNLFWLRKYGVLAFRLKLWTARRIEFPHKYSPTEHRGCFWESDGRLKYCQILPCLGFCIWVLEGPVYNGGNYRWRQIFSLSRDTLNSLLIQAGHEPYHARYTWVSAFDEDHGTIHLQTPQGLLSYDISEKRFTPIPASLSSNSGFWGHQPFTCNKLNSPGIDRPSRKRKAESEDACIEIM